jgi:hypothetical protein
MTTQTGNYKNQSNTTILLKNMLAGALGACVAEVRSNIE